MRALITGGHGFVGRHLAQHLLSCGDDVALTYFPGEEEAPNAVAIPTATQSLALDVTKAEMVNEVVSLLQPDVVYHLAAISFVPKVEDDFAQVYKVNTLGTMNVIEGVRKHSKNSRVLFVSSAEVYGDPRPGSLPLTELAELRPMTAYGVSKASADLAAFRYSYRDNIHIIRVRPFPHLGPGQSESFAISGFAKQVVSAKLGLSEAVVRVGNLEARRDYSDVSDIVRGYREAVLNGKPGEAYNLCSGESVGVGELLEMLIKLSGVDVEIVVDPDRYRSIDVADVYGSYTRANRDFGWKPRVEREAMLDSLLAHWTDFLTA